MREQQIITAVEGHHQNIVFLIPPLCFADEDVKKFSTALKTILESLENLPKEAIIENIANGAERYSKLVRFISNDLQRKAQSNCNQLRPHCNGCTYLLH